MKNISLLVAKSSNKLIKLLSFLQSYFLFSIPSLFPLLFFQLYLRVVYKNKSEHLHMFSKLIGTPQRNGGHHEFTPIGSRSRSVPRNDQPAPTTRTLFQPMNEVDAINNTNLDDTLESVHSFVQEVNAPPADHSQRRIPTKEFLTGFSSIKEQEDRIRQLDSENYRLRLNVALMQRLLSGTPDDHKKLMAENINLKADIEQLVRSIQQYEREGGQQRNERENDLLQRNRELQKKENELVQHNRELKRNEDDLIRRLKEMENGMDERFQHFENQLAQKDRQIEALNQAQNDADHDKFRELQRAIAEKEDEISRLREAHVNLSRENDHRLEELLQELQAKINRYEHKIDSLTSELNFAQEGVNNKDGRMKDMERQNDLLTSELHEYEHQMHVLQRKVVLLENELSDMERNAKTNASEDQRENIQLKEQVTKLKSDLNDAHSHNTGDDFLRNELNAATSKVDSLEMKILQLRRQADSQESENIKLQRKAADYESQLDTLKRDKVRWEIQLLELKKENTQLRKGNSSHLDKINVQLEKQVAELQKECLRLETQVRRQPLESEHLSKLEEQNVKIRRSKAELEEQNMQMKRSKALLEDQVLQSDVKIQRLSNELQEQASKATMLEEDLSQQRAKTIRLNDVVAHLESQLERYRLLNVDLESKVMQFQQEELQYQQKEISRLQSERKTLEDELRRKNEAIRSSSNSDAEVGILKTRNNRLEEQLRETQRDLESAYSAKLTAEKELDILRATVGNLLDQDVLKSQLSESEYVISELQNEVRKLNRELQKGNTKPYLGHSATSSSTTLLDIANELRSRLERENDNLLHQINRLKVLLNTDGSLELEITQLLSANEELKLMLERYADRVHEVDGRDVNIARNEARNQARIRALEVELASKEDWIKHLESSRGKLDELERERLERELESTQRSLREQNKVGTLEEEKRVWETEKVKMNIELNDLRRNHLALKREKLLLDTNVTILNNRIKALEANVSSSDNDAVKSILEVQLQEATALNADLTQSLSDANATTARLEDKIKQLESDNADLVKRMESSRGSNDKKVKELTLDLLRTTRHCKTLADKVTLLTNNKLVESLDKLSVSDANKLKDDNVALQRKVQELKLSNYAITMANEVTYYKAKLHDFNLKCNDLQMMYRFMIDAIRNTDNRLKNGIARLVDVGVYPDYNALEERKMARGSPMTFSVLAKMVLAAVRIKRRYERGEHRKLRMIELRLDIERARAAK